MKTLTVRNSSTMCLMLLEREKKEGTIKKEKKNEAQVRVSKIQKWN